MIMKSISRHISEGLLTGPTIDISNPSIPDLLEIMYNPGPVSKKANKELVGWMKNKTSDSKAITISQ